MRISPFTNDLILRNNQLIRNERQRTMKFYGLRFGKKRKRVLTYRTIIGMVMLCAGMRTGRFILTSMIVKGFHHKEGKERQEQYPRYVCSYISLMIHFTLFTNRIELQIYLYETEPANPAY